MRKGAQFALVFAPEAIDHVEAIERKYHRLIQQALDAQLCHTPGQQTRNRKPLQSPTPHAATWELRFGPHNRFRAFYEIDEAGRTVHILAIGVKEGGRLRVAGEEFEL
jgi:hypothetical protein